MDVGRAQALVDDARAQGRSRLREPEALELLEVYGVPAARARIVPDADGAAAAVADVGAPLVLKVVSPDIVHKSDIGGVRVGVRDAAEARTATEELLARVRSAQPDARIEGVLVQRMGGPGLETIVGISRDPMKKHHKFIDKYDLAVPLASDEDGRISDAFGTWVQKSMYGRKYMGMERSTFVIGSDGRVLKAWRKVKVPGHAEAVLEAAKALG